MIAADRQPSLVPIDTHLLAIAARHPNFPSRLKNKPMSKPLYEEIQSFLLDRWGPMAGWCQAVMFAADLKESTVLRTPRALVKTQSGGVVKLETPADSTAGSPASPISTVLATPADEPSAWIAGTEAESPLKGRSKPRAQRPVPVRQPSSSSKRKFATSSMDAKAEEVGVKTEAGVAVEGLPPAYVFKRTRSAARIELARSRSSGVGSAAADLTSLHV